MKVQELEKMHMLQIADNPVNDCHQYDRKYAQKKIPRSWFFWIAHVFQMALYYKDRDSYDLKNDGGQRIWLLEWKQMAQ